MNAKDDLISELGRPPSSQELSEILGLDHRTVTKYADYWGGVEVYPGKFRFFEKLVKEVLNAEFNDQTRSAALARDRSLS